jgi:hypothetical protein
MKKLSMTDEEKKAHKRKEITRLTLKINERNKLNDRDARKIREYMKELNGRL